LPARHLGAVSALEKESHPVVLYSGLALVPFIIAGSLIAPIWIAPLFNKFESMQDTALEAKILALADRAGIAGSRSSR
jgi:hypothetical protein